MALKKTLMIAGAVTSIGLATTLGAHAVSAESDDASGNGPMSNLVTKIAEKFNLEESKVQEVFEEHKDEVQAGHKVKIEERLTQAVKNGELTEEQKAAILAKMEEFHSQHEASRDEFKNMTPEERHAAMEQKRTELEAWAEENEIPEKYLRFVGPMVKHVQGPRGEGGQTIIDHKR